MKKRNLKLKTLHLRKQSISKLESITISGGAANTTLCRPWETFCIPTPSIDSCESVNIECYWSIYGNSNDAPPNLV